jgi:hypothetical protein
MATITRIELAVPETREGVAGFALTWRGNAPSPDWIIKSDFGALYRANRNDTEALTAMRAAYDAGAEMLARTD